MTVGDALRSALRPALIVGPFLGLIGFMALVAISLLAGEAADGIGMVLIFGAIVALVVGLAVATPACFVGTTAMLLLSARDTLWASMPRWIAAGALTGPVPVALLWVLSAPEADADWATGLVVGLFGAVLGALGGWLCRRIAASRIEELDAVDVGVFA